MQVKTSTIIIVSTAILLAFGLGLTAQSGPTLDYGSLAAFKGYDCTSLNGKITLWKDARPQPTEQEWLTIKTEYDNWLTTEKIRKLVSTEQMVEALWRKVMENDATQAEAIQAIRDKAR